MSVVAVEKEPNTTPEPSSWNPRPVPPTPEIDQVQAELNGRVRRLLEARKYTRVLDPQAQNANRIITAQGDQRINEQRSPSTVIAATSIRDDIDRTIRGVFPAAAPTPRMSLQPLQEWEGYVTAIGSETFSARLTDVTAGRHFEEETTEFPISDLSDDDRELLTLGAIFRWVIGYQRSAGGTKRRVSQVTFRRLPAWTRADLERAKKRSEELADTIVWD